MLAFFLLKPEPTDQPGSLRTDGGKLYYHAETVVQDGYGSFPEKTPEYPVAFLLPREDDFFGEPDLPDRVTKVTIMEDNPLRVE